MIRYRPTLFLALLYLLALPDMLSAQRLDYDEFPQMNADYIHMELRMEVEEEPLLVRGEVLYTLQLLRDGIEEIRLDAIRMDIESVEWNGEPVEFRIEDDRLHIELTGNDRSARDHRLGIRYVAEPTFGVHVSESGVIWSSTLPTSVRHWLPVSDHPRNRFTTDVTLLIPTGREGIFSGVPGEESAESVDLKRAQFYSDSEIPASSLAFAVGGFDRRQISSGRHRIDLYSEEGVLGEEEAVSLLESSRDLLNSSAELFRSAYYSRTLSLVVLQDDRWEQKSYGAGVVFGYSRLPNLNNQVASGIIGQWIGVQLQEERWKDASAVLLLQSLVMNHLNLERTDREELSDGMKTPPRESLYHVFSLEARENWLDFIQAEPGVFYRSYFQENSGSLLSELPEVTNWYDFASWVYEESGIPMMNSPKVSAPETEQQEPSVSRYRVTYNLNEEEGTLELYFHTESSPVEDLVTVTAVEVTREGRRERELTFTGASDQIVIQESQNLENLILRVEGREDLTLIVEKPFRFWIHQLRSEEDPGLRVEAATALGEFEENPDLQLALLDILDQETDSQVQAEMVRSLASITSGASGTEQLFRQRYSNDLETDLQLALLEAYGNYTGSESVIGQLRSTILNASGRTVQIQAVRSLARVTEPERFVEMASGLFERESVYPAVSSILEELSEIDPEHGVEAASRFVKSGYPFYLRSEALDYLMEQDSSAENWQNRVEQLSADRDPRIRCKVLEGLQYLTDNQREMMAEERLIEEYDERVLFKIRQITGEQPVEEVQGEESSS